MKVFLAGLALAVAVFHEVKCEADFGVGLPPRFAEVRYGNPFSSSPPSGRYRGQYRNHRHNHQYDEGPPSGGYGSSEYAEYGSAQRESPPPSQPKQQFRAQHPNSIPPSEYNNKPGFEVVRAPVIYHQTVTDSNSDVTNALANALNVVQTLRQPGSRQQQGGWGQQDSGNVYQGEFRQQESEGGYQDQGGYGQPVRTLTNVEFVSHTLPQQGQRQNRPRPTTVTTTIVDVPQSAPSPTPVIAQQAQRLEQPRAVPVVADLPPSPPSSPASVIATSAAPARVSTAAPIRSSAVLATPSAGPRLIIPSQSQVTTLARTSTATKVQSLNAPQQFRTVIQPVYIPYAVDQNGQPVGPLPDYHTMDFGALLNAQQQLLTVAPHHPTVASAPTAQLLEAHPIQQPQQVLHVEQPQQQLIQQFIQIQQEPQQPEQQFYVQQDHVVAASSSSSSSEVAPEVPSPKRTSTRSGRRRRVKKARKIAQRT